MTASSGCRHCGAPLEHSFCDLGMSPLANAYIEPQAERDMERFYPLHAFVCSACWLVQLQEFQTPAQIFGDYAYFSSYSESWLAHARAYVEAVTARFSLSRRSQVIEIASNDGYLLQYFAEKAVPVLGIEPAANVAKVAEQKGIPSRVAFFGTETAGKLVSEGKSADLLLGNNVLAHVPDLNDFVRGLQLALKPGGVITLEFPHLLQLMRENQFDTIYHEHFSYFSFVTVQKVFVHHGLRIFDVEQLRAHGGSLRIYACHTGHAAHVETERVASLLEAEHAAGLTDLAAYRDFSERVKHVKRRLLAFLIDAKTANKQVVGYGAPAKGNTLLNYCGIRTDFLNYTVDRSPHKQGRALPGVHIPIYAPDKVRETKPDYLLILPWNLRDEVMGQMAHVRDWGGKFVVPIPQLTVLE